MEIPVFLPWKERWRAPISMKRKRLALVRILLFTFVELVSFLTSLGPIIESRFRRAFKVPIITWSSSSCGPPYKLLPVDTMNQTPNTEDSKSDNNPFVFNARLSTAKRATAMAASKNLHPFIFADRTIGIIVIYKNNRAVGRASPYTMALASPFWKKFVFPPFRQTSEKDNDDPSVSEKTRTTEMEGSKSTAEPVEKFKFTEDSAEALLVLLSRCSVPISGP